MAVKTDEVKGIIIEPGQPPRFTGDWSMADFYALLRFILEMPLIRQSKDDSNG